MQFQKENAYEQNHQTQCAYYANGNSKIKYKQSGASTAARWWVSSAYYSYAYYFCCVITDGSAGNSTSRYSRGLAPAFKT